MAETNKRDFATAQLTLHVGFSNKSKKAYTYLRVSVDDTRVSEMVFLRDKDFDYYVNSVGLVVNYDSDAARNSYNAGR